MTFYLNSRTIMKTTIIEPENKFHLADSNLFENIGFQRRQKCYKRLLHTHTHTPMLGYEAGVQSALSLTHTLTHTCKHTAVTLQLEKWYHLPGLLHPVTDLQPELRGLRTLCHGVIRGRKLTREAFGIVRSPRPSDWDHSPQDTDGWELCWSVFEVKVRFLKLECRLSELSEKD